MRRDDGQNTDAYGNPIAPLQVADSGATTTDVSPGLLAGSGDANANQTPSVESHPIAQNETYWSIARNQLIKAGGDPSDADIQRQVYALMQMNPGVDPRNFHVGDTITLIGPNSGTTISAGTLAAYGSSNADYQDFRAAQAQAAQQREVVALEASIRSTMSGGVVPSDQLLGDSFGGLGFGGSGVGTSVNGSYSSSLMSDMTNAAGSVLASMFGISSAEAAESKTGKRSVNYLDVIPTDSADAARAQKDFDAAISSRRDAFIAAGEKYGIDPRAIVGAMTWEYEQNHPGRDSDPKQYWVIKNFGFDPANGIGWGSMHDEVASRLLPGRTILETADARLNLDTAIPLTAQQISNQANAFIQGSGGRIDPRNNPAFLTYLYNNSEQWITSRAAVQGQLLATQQLANPTVPLNSLPVRLDISQNPMSSWVYQNMAKFSNYTSPKTFGSSNTAPIQLKVNP